MDAVSDVFFFFKKLYKYLIRIFSRDNSKEFLICYISHY